MTKELKDRMLGGLFGTISGIIVGLVLLFWGNKMTASESFKNTVDSKADKTELEKLDVEVQKKVDEVDFVEYKKVNEAAHQELELEITSELRRELENLEKSLNRESDIRDENLREYIKALYHD